MRNILPFSFRINSNLHKKSALFFCASLILSLVVADYFRVKTNTIYDNGNWVSQKTKLAKGIMGAVAYLVTPRALINNSLDLGAWYGYQEVQTRDPYNVYRLRFKIKINDKSYADAIIRSSSGPKYAIRLSDSPSYNSGLMLVGKNGEFLSESTSQLAGTINDSWNDVEVVFGEENIKLSINSVEVGSYETGKILPIYFGFRGSLSGGEVKDVFAYSRDNRLIFQDNFSNTRTFWVVLVICTILLFLMLTLISKVLEKSKRVKNSVAATTSFWFLITILMFGFYIYWRYFWKNYPIKPTQINWHNFQSNFEDDQDVIVRVLGAYAERNQQTYRILFLGTSQTWGAGATDDLTTMTSRLELLLNRQDIEVINTGISGSNSKQIYKLFVQQWLDLGPRMVILNLGNNDNLSDLQTYVQKMVELSKQRNITVVIIGEANSAEAVAYDLPQKHAFLESYAKENNITYIPMHDILARYTDTGFLWWDVVHLTDYGQLLAAKTIFDTIYPIITQ